MENSGLRSRALRFLLFASVALGLCGHSSLGSKPHGQVPPSDSDATVPRPNVEQAYGRLPVSFEPNYGQSDPGVKFLSRGAGYTLFLTEAEAVLLLREESLQHSENSASPIMTQFSGPSENSPYSVLRIGLAGAIKPRVIRGEDLQGGISNYFIGRDSRNWHRRVPNYGAVKYEGVYREIDLVYRGNSTQLEFDFVVRPGADPRSIELKFDGATKLRIDSDGNLIVDLGRNQVLARAPVVFQELEGGHETIRGGYVLKDGNNRVGFKIGRYDSRRSIVIDPTLVYSTYLGGSSEDRAYGIAVDRSGNAYLTGVTPSVNFPVTNGAYQTSARGQNDAFVAKLNPTGGILLYSSFLGGSANDDGYGIVVDGLGDAYIAGVTR